MSNTAVAVFGFLSFMFLARTFSPDKFGEWLLYLIPAGLVEMLRFAITKVSIIRFLSGTEGEDQKELIGSNWFLGLLLTVIVIILMLLTRFFFGEWVSSSGYYYFFVWYPVLSIFNLPYNNALGLLQAKQNFTAILTIKLMSKGLFFLFILVNYFFLSWDIIEVIYAHLAVNLITSIWSIARGWDGIKYLFKTSKSANRKLFHFGKFTIGTMLGSNLLKSADTLLIGISPFGASAVALYSVPLKLTELMEIPLRSFLATAFPKMSKASMRNDPDTVRKVFYTYSGAITILFIPMIIICILFAKFFILILGGEQYTHTMLPIFLFQIFAIYSIFLPIDRFTGVALDSINKPKKNFYKVVIMALLNIVGDLVALYIFKSLIAVALVTILFTVIGQIVGFQYLSKEIPVNYREIFKYGFNFYKEAFKQYVKQ
ncbi:MAG: oligosaccharide flippase family protein [Bacteroidales bacterium]|nr:oligosaccharide flippase family protein [Bacteroidales bacterium]